MRTPGWLRILKWLHKITLRSRIAPLPRMYASHYDRLDEDSARIMSRYGIRSPSGLRLAMRRHNAETIDELASKLEHHRVRHEYRKRFRLGLRRMTGGYVANPHTEEIKRLLKKPTPEELEIRERIKRQKTR